MMRYNSRSDRIDKGQNTTKIQDKWGNHLLSHSLMVFQHVGTQIRPEKYMVERYITHRTIWPIKWSTNKQSTKWSVFPPTEHLLKLL